MLMWWHHLQLGDTLRKVLCKFESNPTNSFQDIDNFVPPMFFWPSDHFLTICDMTTELTPQQLIIQSAQATADAIASALTAWTASISLPIYDWDSKDAYHSFSIFLCTLENWLLLNHIATDSEDHLQYVFAALGTKSLEMHAQWIPTGDEEEQRAIKVKACFPWKNTTGNDTWHQHPCMTRRTWGGCCQAWRGPKDLVAHMKTLMDCCKMINNEHREHELHWCISIPITMKESSSTSLWPNPSIHLLAS